MKSKLLTMTLLIVFVTLPFGTASISDLADQEFNLNYTEAADYTNHRDDSMLISVENVRSEAYSIIDYNDDSIAPWISGSVQIQVSNAIEIGILNQSEFNVVAGGDRTASVNNFNITLPLPANYSSVITAESVRFIGGSNDTVGVMGTNQTYTSALVGPPLHNTVLDANEWVNQLEVYFTNYVNQVNIDHDLNAELNRNGLTLSYAIDGSMRDYHTFSYHPNRIQTAADYNQILVEGGFSVSYNEDGILDEFTENYEVFYDNIRIMQYSLSIQSGSGSLGNVIVNNNDGLINSFDIYMLYFSFLFVGILVYYVRMRKLN